MSCELEEMPYLDYIFTIDIFNEGVDIPEINQVLMLRPTESPIVFVQQLGRGLRKADDKEYVVIIDFIGNYMNNYMIPIALSGDRSYNKDQSADMFQKERELFQEHLQYILMRFPEREFFNLLIALEQMMLSY